MKLTLQATPPDTPLPRPILIGGCPRSGSTVLGAVLGSSPSALTVPESDFSWRMLRQVGPDGMLDLSAAVEFLSRDWRFRLWDLTVVAGERGRVTVADLMGQLARGYAYRSGKPDVQSWVDHTPGNIFHAISLERHLPGARFVHLVRDGRAVAASVIPLDWGPDDVFDAARWWATNIALGVTAAQALGPDIVRTVRYEDLVTEPHQVLEDLCGFLGLSFDKGMVSRRDYTVQPYTFRQHERVSSPLNPQRSSAWQHVLTPRQVEAFEYLTGDLLESLGYRPLHGPAARSPGSLDRLWQVSRSAIRRQVADKPKRLLRRAALRQRPSSQEEVRS